LRTSGKSTVRRYRINVKNRAQQGERMRCRPRSRRHRNAQQYAQQYAQQEGATMLEAATPNMVQAAMMELVVECTHY
jgi:hypothetical protein